MTIDEIEEHLKIWQSHIELTDERMSDMFDILKLSPESPVYSMTWELMDAYTVAISVIVGDDCNWLDWYRAEKDMGMSKYEASPPGGKLRKIKNVRDLAKLIFESSKDQP